MSTAPAKAPSNFELETKIRLIIKELLEATSNKLSDFTNRIDGYEKFYFTFTDKVGRLEYEHKNSKEEIERLLAHVNTQYEKMNSMEARSKQRLDKSTELFERLSEGFVVVKETQEQFKKQFGRLNEDVTRTKNHYVEQNKLLQEYRDEAGERILKFVQHNVEINRDVNSKFDELSREMDKIKLSFESRKKDFQQCFEAFNLQNFTNKKNEQDMQFIKQQLEEKATIHEMKSSGKELKLWVEGRINDFEKLAVAKVESVVNNHKGLKGYGEDIQRLYKQLELTESELSDSIRSLTTRTLGSESKLDDKLQRFATEISKDNAELQKDLNRRLEDTKAELKAFKTEQVNSVMRLKAQLESKLEQQTNQIMESKNQKAAISEEMMQDLQRTRQADLLRLNNKIDQVESQLINQIRLVEKSTVAMSSSRKYTSEGSLSTSELSKQIEERLEEHEEQINRLNMKVEYLENCNSRNKEFQQQLTQQTDEFIRVTTQRMESTEKRCSDVLAENQATVDKMLEDYAAMKLSVQQKMESVSSSVTKCRSDVIVIGDSFATRFQQLVRKHDAEQKKTQGILKVVPMIGQCINLLLAICFDFEYENSRVFLNLQPCQDPQQFNTLNDGKLYEYKQKRKQGTIFYRNRTVRKTDLVKAHLSSFIDIWDSLQSNEFKEQFSFFPKDFFKGTVEKKLNSLIEASQIAIQPAPTPQQQHLPQSELLSLQQPVHILLSDTNKLPALTYQSTSKINRSGEPSSDKITDVHGRTFHIRQQLSTTQKKMSVSFMDDSPSNMRRREKRQTEV